MPRDQLAPEQCRKRGFQKGTSGNPKGKPPIIREVQQLARTYTEDAVEALHEVFMDRRANGSARVQAAVAMLDRGWGRPKQSVDVSVDHRSSGLTDALARMAERQRQLDAQQTALTQSEGEVIDAEVTLPQQAKIP